MRVFLFDYKRVFPLVGLLKPVVSMVVCFDNERCFTLCLPQGTWSWALATHFTTVLILVHFLFLKIRILLIPDFFSPFLTFFLSTFWPNLFSLK